MFSFLMKKPSWQALCLMCVGAFLVRALVFYGYVQQDERYQQPDSIDYHCAAVSLALGKGMVQIWNEEPIFWRTPGYPCFLAFFYRLYDEYSLDFFDHEESHRMALWVQIILSSFLPLLFFWLALLLTQSYLVGWLAACVSIFHVGCVLASMFLLTDGLALLLFVVFLICLYRLIMRKLTYRDVCGAVIFLSLFTWMRPMGIYIALLSACLIFFAQEQRLKKIKMAFLFLTLFFASVSPWYMRNYAMTGHVFFCPIFGPYLTCFCVPKIMERVEHKPLIECFHQASHDGGVATKRALLCARQRGEVKVFCKQLACLPPAVEWIKDYPLYFAYDWLVQVVKTMFDVYSSQLVAFAAGTFKSDPLIEFLSEKIAACLYVQSMSVGMRLVCWIEFFFSLCMWLGIAVGLILFGYRTFSIKTAMREREFFKVWLISGLMIGLVVCMTGGFGYARLRLPVEPLMVILGITFWVWFIGKFK